MEIYEVLRILSSQSKAKILALLCSCPCNHNRVGDMCIKFHLQQANVSKHLSDLLEAKVVVFAKEGKEVFYKLDPDFKSKWMNLLKNIFESDSELKKYFSECNC